MLANSQGSLQLAPRARVNPALVTDQELASMILANPRINLSGLHGVSEQGGLTVRQRVIDLSSGRGGVIDRRVLEAIKRLGDDYTITIAGLHTDCAGREKIKSFLISHVGGERVAATRVGRPASEGESDLLFCFVRVARALCPDATIRFSGKRSVSFGYARSWPQCGTLIHIGFQ